MTTSTPARDTVLHTIDWVGALRARRSVDFHADAAALMTRVNATLEEWIRDRPEQWLWVHRRWPD